MLSCPADFLHVSGLLSWLTKITLDNFASVFPMQLALLRELESALFLCRSKIIVYKDQLVTPVGCRQWGAQVLPRTPFGQQITGKIWERIVKRGYLSTFQRQSNPLSLHRLVTQEALKGNSLSPHNADDGGEEAAIRVTLREEVDGVMTSGSHWTGYWVARHSTLVQIWIDSVTSALSTVHHNTTENTSHLFQMFLSLDFGIEKKTHWYLRHLRYCLK